MTRSIDAELISQYRRDGVVCIRQLLSPDDLRELNQAFNWSINHGTGKLANFRRGEAQSFTDLCNPGALPVYQRLLQQGPYAEILSQLWSTEQIWFMYEQVFFKHGGKTERTAWHQDAPYLPVEGEHLAVFWITLNAVSAQSSLEFVAGSHLGKQYNGKDYRGSNDPLYAGSDMEPLPDIETQRERWNIVSWDIEPGDVVVFHPGVLHGGGATEFDAERRTVSLRFFGEDARYIQRPEKTIAPGVPGLEESLTNGAAFRHSAFMQLNPLKTQSAYR